MWCFLVQPRYLSTYRSLNCSAVMDALFSSNHAAYMVYNELTREKRPGKIPRRCV